MSVYQEQYKKYVDVSKAGHVNYFSLMNGVRNVMVEKPEKVKANAVVMFGLSGNGKSTWIKEFIKENPDYVVASMDEVVNGLYEKNQRQVMSDEIVEAFGNEIESICRSGRNVIIDGNFLNLLTRSALADTLKTFSYQVNLVDITDNVNSILKIRIMDVASKRMGVKIDSSNVMNYVNDPNFNAVYTEIINYYNRELASSNLNEQITYDAIGLGVNNVFNRNTPYEEIIRISQDQK